MTEYDRVEITVYPATFEALKAGKEAMGMTWDGYLKHLHANAGRERIDSDALAAEVARLEDAADQLEATIQEVDG